MFLAFGRDKRVRYPAETKLRAVEMIRAGYGRDVIAAELGATGSAVRKWQRSYWTAGHGRSFAMGTGKRSYAFELKLEAARAVVDGGMALPEAMSRFGVAAENTLGRWCATYQRGGAAALRPKLKGRPRGAAPKTREQELEERCRRLEAEVAYLKNEVPGGGKAGTREKCQVIAELSGKGHRVCDLLSAARIPSSTYHSSRRRPPKGPTRPELQEAVAEVFSRTPNGCGHRQIAMCLCAERGASITDKTVLRMMREMGIRRAIRRERPCRRYSSYRGAVGQTFGNMLGRDFSAEAPWQKMGTDVTELRQPWGKAYFAPVYDLCTREIVAWSTSESPNMAQQAELLDRLAARMPGGARPILHSDMGWQYQHAVWCGRLRREGIVQSMSSRKESCLDNACTEGMFGPLKDEFSRGATSGRTAGRSRQTSTRTSGTGTQGGGREPGAASRPRNSGSLSEQLLNRYYRLQEMGRSHRSPAQQAEPRVLLSAQARLCFCVRYAQVGIWYLPLPPIQLLRVRAHPRSEHRSCRCAGRPSHEPSL